MSLKSIFNGETFIFDCKTGLFSGDVVIDAKSDLSSMTAQLSIGANGVASENNVAQVYLECIGGGGGGVPGVVAQRFLGGAGNQYGLSLTAGGVPTDQLVIGSGGSVGVGRVPGSYGSGSLEVSGNLVLPSLVGEVVVNGATPVLVPNPNITASSIVLFTLKTAGGTPSVVSATNLVPGTSFDAVGLAGDTSTWNYLIVG
jgi:hypothetical protein